MAVRKYEMLVVMERSYFVTGHDQLLCHEATADVSTAEVHCCLAHECYLCEKGNWLKVAVRMEVADGKLQWLMRTEMMRTMSGHRRPRGALRPFLFGELPRNCNGAVASHSGQSTRPMKGIVRGWA